VPKAESLPVILPNTLLPLEANFEAAPPKPPVTELRSLYVQ